MSLRPAPSQITPTVRGIEGNCKKILSRILEARAVAADMVVCWRCN